MTDNLDARQIASAWWRSQDASPTDEPPDSLVDVIAAATEAARREGYDRGKAEGEETERAMIESNACNYERAEDALRELTAARQQVEAARREEREACAVVAETIENACDCADRIAARIRLRQRAEATGR
jgi:hypothetical protein